MHLCFVSQSFPSYLLLELRRKCLRRHTCGIVLKIAQCTHTTAYFTLKIGSDLEQPRIENLGKSDFIEPRLSGFIVMCAVFNVYSPSILTQSYMSH